MQACRPKSFIAPLQLGLAVQVHHLYSSRFLVDELYQMGFSSSYSEIQRFESNAAMSLNAVIPGFFPGNFLQYVADNADHNVRTLDGHGTFHGMGMIACSSPGSNIELPIPRADVSLTDLSRISKIDIKYFKHQDGMSKELYFQDIGFGTEASNTSIKSHTPFDTFFKLIWPLKTSRPSWSGFMQLYTKSESHPGKSSIKILPMIDMNPSDLSCINSTLHFVNEQSWKYGVTPVLTFDQPLFQKATFIIRCDPGLKNVVLRLGGFHTEMSFLASIGHIMSSTGLQELLETIYAPNAVCHMLSGKAVHRAIRGHFLVDTALHTLLLSNAIDVPLPLKQINSSENQDRTFTEVESNAEHGDVPEMLIKLKLMYDKLERSEISVSDICSSVYLEEVSQVLDSEKDKLKSNRTACLWLQYMDMISILQQFIRAERISDWIGHLQANRRMLPYFAASGHHLYMKSAHIYLQNMTNLEREHPDIFRQFMDGKHSVRRSERHWAGLSTDLIIEQVLMKSLKSNGGLTRGRGLSEPQRVLWSLAMPSTAEMNAAMQIFTGQEFQTSDQHKEIGYSRRSRDASDTHLLLSFLRDHSPFDKSDVSLRNIETGVTADDKVNSEKAVAIGCKILQDMVDKSIDKYTYKKSQQIVVMNEKNSIKLSGETLTIDPQLLFQRLTSVADRYIDDIASIFKYELCSLPSSMFENNGLPRISQKSTLADAIWKGGDCAIEDTGEDVAQQTSCLYAVDGGSLIHKIPWTRNVTFFTICEQYLTYLKGRYDNTVVVFDGYDQGPSTKDIMHYKRNCGGVGTRVKFELNTPFRSKKDVFLRNKENKQAFVYILGEFLKQKGITVIFAQGDADTTIVETALTSADTNITYVTGEDTDLLVLLINRTADHQIIYFRSDIKQTSTHQRKTWDIQKTRKALGHVTCLLLPFLHALTGCDTTSRIFGIGKALALRVLKTNTQLQETGIQFITCDSKDDIVALGERSLAILVDGDPRVPLDSLRCRKFAAKVMTSTVCVQVHTLPPTSAAAAYHSLRVYLQCRQWMGDSNLRPVDFGWELNDGIYVPIKTDLPPAPESLLNVVRCNCKVNCDSKRCTCRKHGLECSAGCGESRGVSCSNSVTLTEVDAEDSST